jgi:hypothetical protein
MGMSLDDHPKSYTAADIEALTDGAVDRKMAENWHNRGLWLTPSESPPRGKPRLYSLAHLFEALTRAVLVEGGLTHASAKTAIELRLVEAALPKERRRGAGEEIAKEIYSLPELRQRKSDWWWVISYGNDRKASELERTMAVKGSVPIAKVCPRVASVVHISAIVRDVLAYEAVDAR